MGKHSRGKAIFVEDAVIGWSKEPSSIDPHLGEALFEGLYSDDIRVGAAPSIRHIDSISPSYLT